MSARRLHGNGESWERVVRRGVAEGVDQYQRSEQCAERCSQKVQRQVLLAVRGPGEGEGGSGDSAILWKLLVDRSARGTRPKAGEDPCARQLAFQRGSGQCGERPQRQPLVCQLWKPQQLEELQRLQDRQVLQQRVCFFFPFFSLFMFNAFPKVSERTLDNSQAELQEEVKSSAPSFQSWWEIIDEGNELTNLYKPKHKSNHLASFQHKLSTISSTNIQIRFWRSFFFVKVCRVICLESISKCHLFLNFLQGLKK